MQKKYLVGKDKDYWQGPRQRDRAANGWQQRVCC